MKRTKHGDYQKKIRFQVFQDYDIFVIVTDDQHKSIAARYGEELATRIGTALGMTVRAEQPACHVFIRYDSLYKPAESAKVLAHEAAHAVRHMLIWAGVNMEPVDSEIFSYHLGFTVERATKFFEEVRRDQSNRRTGSKKRS